MKTSENTRKLYGISLKNNPPSISPFSRANPPIVNHQKKSITYRGSATERHPKSLKKVSPSAEEKSEKELGRTNF
ncbi:hypothetical protein GWI33_010778 [Rhynchophorus ferrugineus]|uniref:Uncharacterized protein n=1 Tax=Rhynchophorus ferrugineus TaxID=354439 RepID=A0A834IRX0_RHYFE|nr:hypothetical protein GWI33_010778 [Rhynchophorus ferrugineus]